MAYQDVKTPWEGWHVINKIGKGGFGSVYEIERSQYGIREHAAMKVITIPQSADEIDDLLIEGYDTNSITQRFDAFAEDIVREYGMMAQMKGNANIVYCDDYRIIQQDNDFGRDIYIRMELLTPLLKAMDRVSSEAQIIRFGMEMSNALEACQKRKVIHRDIKPQNIFVSDDGVFKLGDFGIARKAEKTTRATVGKGTYQFMAPEVKNELPYGPTVDIYSLGLVMYWLLNDRRCPFFPLPPAVPTHGEEQEALRRRFSGEKIPAPKNGSDELKRIVLKACAFDPKDRYQSAREMREALARLSGEYVLGSSTQNLEQNIHDDPSIQNEETVFEDTPAGDPEEETVGPKFSTRIESLEEERGKSVGDIIQPDNIKKVDDLCETVGPIFYPVSVDETANQEETGGPVFLPKDKLKQYKKKKKVWPVIAVLVVLLMVVVLGNQIGNSQKLGYSSEDLRAIEWINEIEQYRATHKTYELSELISLTEGMAETEYYCYESLKVDDAIIRKYHGEWYISIMVIYLDPVDGNCVYGDIFSYTVDRDRNLDGTTYSLWVTKKSSEIIQTVESESNTKYHWISYVDPDSGVSYYEAFISKYIDGFATETFISNEFYDSVGYYANERKQS